MTTRPAIFKWRQTEPQLILCAVRWYLRYSLSLRDVEELFEERCLHVDHTTVWRWVQSLRAGTRPARAASSEANQQIVAGRRDLCEGEGSLVLPVSSDRFDRRHH